MRRRAVFAALGAGEAAVFSYVLRGALFRPVTDVRLADHDGCMAGPADMRLYAQMFHRHNEITRTVVEIPGGVRTATASASPDLAAQLQAHVSSMYARLDQGAEVMCMSDSLPTLFRHANGYRRQLAIIRCDRRGNGGRPRAHPGHSRARTRGHRLRA